jgi:hypothetical protein
MNELPQNSSIMIRTLFILCLVLAGFAFIPREPPFMDTNWRLISILSAQDKTLIIVPGSIRVSLVVRDSGFKGYSGCNAYSGKCFSDKDSIVFSGAGGTKKNCPGTRAEIENRLYDHLFRDAARYQVYSDTLLLTTHKGCIFKFIKLAD